MSVRQAGRVRPGALVLLNGPLDNPDWWASAAIALSQSDYTVLAPGAGATGPPYAVGWIASIAAQLQTAAPAGPLVFVGHGNAGPLLPALARAQRAAGRRTGGYVFVDATLPRAGEPSHLDVLSTADPALGQKVHDALHEESALWPPDAPQPQPHDFWTEPLPMAVDWPDAPCAYLVTGAEPPGTGKIDFWSRSAHARGWDVAENADVVAGLTEIVRSMSG